MKPKRDEHQFQLTAQQVKALNLPTFESFPYLTTRVIPALYHLALLPRSFEPELLRHIAQRQVAANKLPTCLVLGPADCIYYEVDGMESRSDGIPCGGHAASGKLRLCAEFEHDDELQVRQRLLAAYVEERSLAGGYLFGDLTKGGRDATPDEQLRLAGVQTGGVPRGLDLCPTCGMGWTVFGSKPSIQGQSDAGSLSLRERQSLRCLWWPAPCSQAECQLLPEV